MGAKTPAKLKLRRPMYKCDICDRKLLSAQALKTHQYCIHKTVKPTHTDDSKSNSKKGHVNVKKGVSKVKVPKISTKTVKKVLEPNSDPIEKSSQVTDVRRIEFECPKCQKQFTIYFSAYRHIMKHHCVNSRGYKVPSNSPDLIKPVRVELCVKCNKRVRPEELHACNDANMEFETEFLMNYICTGCSQRFTSVQLFDLHVSGLHSDGVESMFFPTMNEFLTWKDHMENQTKIKYLILGKCNSKQTYRCTYLPNSEPACDLTAHFCPSSIIVQEFSKGIQVHFFKEHYGHSCPNYTLTERYKKYSITPLMMQATGYEYGTNTQSDDKDLYVQFKTLMESIVLEAAKVKVDSLRILVGKALEMTSILTNYEEDDEMTSPITSTNKSMTDDQITNALECLQQTRIKRNLIDNGSEFINHNRMDTDDDNILSPKIVNAFSMAETKDKDVKDKKDEIMSKIDNEAAKQKYKLLTQLPSYNDSYKDFLDKNFKNIEKKTSGNEKNTSSKVNCKVVVDKKVKPLKPVKSEVKQESRKSSPTPKTMENAAPTKKETPTAKTAESKKNTPNILGKPTKKAIMKTKIGQFKPSMSPRKSTESNTSRSSIGKAAVDIQYEVKEQENDCNILILKI
ncbi:uncharacterized protein ACR2FA_010065 [Aphomia sociella]